MPLKKPKVFYGYWIVAATFLSTLIHSGCGFFVFSLFVKPIQSDLGWSRGEIMAAFTAYYIVIGLSSPLVGRLVDRYGARKVIFTGALTAGSGFVLLSMVNSLWQFYLSYAIVGAGMAAIGYVPGSAVVSNWFKKRRGTAIGIMSMGIGAGGLALAPLVGGYLIPNFGWSASYLALAVITCVIVIPLASFVIRTKPAELGLYPDGMEAPEAVSVTKDLPTVSGGLTLKMALATPAFWLISVCFLSSNFSQVGVIQNQVPYLEDAGFPVAMAATALGVLGLGSALSKFFFGWLCDHIQAKYACSIGLVLQVVSIAILMNIGPASPATIIWLYAIMMGISSGSWLPTMSMLTSTNFGLASYGAIFGAVAVSQAIGTATGPLTAGFMYDAINSYHLAFILFIALYAISIPTVLAVRRPK
ncbi:MFS transporter [Chloroflexota bacterium]